MERTKPNPRWIDRCIALGAGFFILALVLSAVFDPKIRTLHALQALIYVMVIVLTRRGNAWGFGAGCVLATLWNYTSLFHTSFIRNGVEQLWGFFLSGQMHRPVLLIAVVAALGHVLMIIACLAGFLRLRPGLRRWGQFAAGGVLAVG